MSFTTHTVTDRTRNPWGTVHLFHTILHILEFYIQVHVNYAPKMTISLYWLWWDHRVTPVVYLLISMIKYIMCNTLQAVFFKESDDKSDVQWWWKLKSGNCSLKTPMIGFITTKLC